MKNQNIKIEKEMSKRKISVNEFETIIQNDFSVYNSIRIAIDKILLSGSVDSTNANLLKSSANLERYRKSMQECHILNDSFYEYLKDIISGSLNLNIVADNIDHNLLVFRSENGGVLFFNNEDYTLYPIGEIETDELEKMDAIIDLFPFIHKDIKLCDYVSKPVASEDGGTDVSYSISNKKGRTYWNNLA
jgi:hypothetical protein